MRRFALVIVGVMVAAAPATAQMSFLAARAYPLADAAEALAIVVGDFNKDGKLDTATIVLTGGSTDRVQIMLGAGDGTFTPGPGLNVAPGPSALAVGDFNRDSRLDLAVTNWQYNNVTIALGNGDGTFTIGQTVTVGTTPVTIIAADLDGDGNPDLITANARSGDVSVMKGAGDGTFGAAVAYTVGTEPRSLSATRINADGAIDLIVANRRSGSISVLLNHGDGTFAATANVPVGTNPFNLVAADFNGDSRQDVAISDPGSGTLWTMLGNGDGTFQAPQNAGIAGSAVASADFNGDGVVDLVVLNNVQSQFRIMIGAGNGSFVLTGKYATHQSPNFVALGDFNGDGHVDVVSSCLSLDSTIAVALGAGDGSFLAAPTVFAGTSGAYEAHVADLNHDGIPDLIVAVGLVAVHLGTGGGQFQNPVVYAGGGGRSTAIADVNHDGNLDVVTEAAVMLGTGTGTLQPSIALPLPPLFELNAQDVAEGDFNGDGNPDVIVAGSNDLELMLGNGDGTFQAPASLPGAGVVTVADLNGDGRLDVVTQYANKPAWLIVLLGNGDATFRFTSLIYGGGYWPRPTVGDFNSDGIPDLVLSHPGGGSTNPTPRISIAAGNGDGTFRPLLVVNTVGNPGQPAAADFNGDGKEDLAYSVGGALYVAAGNGDGTFQPATIYAAQGLWLTAGDYDGDGKIDLIGSATNSTLALVRNTSR